MLPHSILCRGVSGGRAGWAIAHPDFGRIESTAGRRRRATMRYITTCPPSVWQPLTPLNHFRITCILRRKTTITIIEKDFKVLQGFSFLCVCIFRFIIKVSCLFFCLNVCIMGDTIIYHGGLQTREARPNPYNVTNSYDYYQSESNNQLPQPQQQLTCTYLPYFLN